jgi:hypothetical protein
MTCLTPNTQLLIRGGTTAAPVFYNESIESSPSGTSWTNKVRIANFPGEVVWLRPTFGQHVFELQAHEQYVEFDGINMDPRNTSLGIPVRISSNPAPDTGNPHHIRIQNAEIINGSDGVPNQGTNGGAIAVTVFTARPGVLGFNEFINLTIHGGGDVADFAYAFYINGGDNLIERCNIFDTSGYGIQLYNGWTGSPYNADQPARNIIRNNVIHDITRSGDAVGSAGCCRVSGIVIATYGGAGNQVYNNIVYNLSFTNGFGGGIELYSGTDTVVYNNTVYNTLQNISGIVLDQPQSGTTILRNNITYQNSGGGLALNNGATATQDHNLFTGNPLFVNAPTDFHLQAGSPGINGGTPVTTTCEGGVGNCDIAGTTRPQGSAFDIGAFEQ